MPAGNNSTVTGRSGVSACRRVGRVGVSDFATRLAIIRTSKQASSDKSAYRLSAIGYRLSAIGYSAIRLRRNDETGWKRFAEEAAAVESGNRNERVKASQL
jgi:hypothetical protein